jgi:hypothetical protein
MQGLSGSTHRDSTAETYQSEAALPFELLRVTALFKLPRLSGSTRRKITEDGVLARIHKHSATFGHLALASVAAVLLLEPHPLGFAGHCCAPWTTTRLPTRWVWSSWTSLKRDPGASIPNCCSTGR